MIHRSLRTVRTPQLASALRRRAGFTAIEMSAVVTIILILSLIIIPIVRNRVDEAKVVAADDDMAGIEKAELFAFSYTSHYFRLQDLDRPAPSLEGTLTPAQRSRELLKLPQAYWNQPILSNTGLVDGWKGPFYAMHHTDTVANLIASKPSLFRGNPGPTVQQGPILETSADTNDWQTLNDGQALTRARHPIDPWGNPYIFFGPGKMGTAGGNYIVPVDNETDFGTGVIYSLGPDGLAGSVVQDQNNSALFTRELGLLGTGDDRKREF